MRLTILGSGTAIPSADRGPTSIWIRSPQTSLLLDCGSGAVQKFVAAGGELASLDAILLSHAHLDHVGDLTTLLFAFKVPGPHSQGDRPLLLLHSDALGAHLDKLLDAFGVWLTPKSRRLERVVLSAGRAQSVGQIDILPFEVEHHDSSLGFRLAGPEGQTLAVPGDTAYCASLVEGVRGTDLLVAECSTTDDQPLDGHLSPDGIVRLVRKARVKKVILTHLYPQAHKANVVAQVRRRLTDAGVEVFEAFDGFDCPVAGPIADQRPSRRPTPATVQTPRPPPKKNTAAIQDDWFRESGSHVSEDEVRALIEADLARFDGRSLDRRKFGRPGGPGPKGEGSREERTPYMATATPTGPSWTTRQLATYRPSRAQRKMAKRAAERRDVAELNLRGDTRATAIARLRGAVERWKNEGQVLCRVITGKGKQSAGNPVVKLAVVNWVSGVDGRPWIAEWAPVTTADGNFGAVVIRLRR